MDIQKYTCLVVDDEPIARKILVSYIEQLPFLQLAAECNNAFSAIDYLKGNSTTCIILLDINMPNLSGIQLVKAIQPHQPVIFTTAYTEHAIESYELNAVDYLLKPFSIDRFTKAIYKAVDMLNTTYNNGHTAPENIAHSVAMQRNPKKNIKKTLSRILLKKGADFHFCHVEEVACFYTESRLVFLVDFKGQKHLTDFKTLNTLAEELDPTTFFKANRQFILNINAIKKFRQFERVKLSVELAVKLPETIIISQGNVSDFKNWIAAKENLA